MKNSKRTTVTVETFESVAIRLNKMPKKILCNGCQKSINDFQIMKIISAQIISDVDGIYLFITDSGMWFFLETE